MVNLILVLVGLAAHARVTAEMRGLTTLASGRQLWTEHKVAAPGRPTLILVNGLTYTTREWDEQVEKLLAEDPGVGVYRYDARGMGPHAGRRYEDITLDDQVADLIELKRKAKISGPVFLLGLSYGGAVTLKTAAEHPDQFDGFIAQAPFLNALPDLHEVILKLVRLHRATVSWLTPWDLRNDDELYDHYLRVMVFATYPSAEPVVTRDWPHKLEHIYRMVKGARHWRARDVIPRLPARKVHLMFAEDDEYVPIKDSRAFAAALPPGLIGSILYMKHVRHKIPEVAPEMAAHWILRLVNGEPGLNEGLTYAVDGRKPSRCETLLGKTP